MPGDVAVNVDGRVDGQVRRTRLAPQAVPAATGGLCGFVDEPDLLRRSADHLDGILGRQSTG